MAPTNRCRGAGQPYRSAGVVWQSRSFLRTALPMQPGADVALRLPGQRGQVVASGQVVRRVAPSEGDRPGLGVRFVESMDEKALGAFLGTSLRASLDHDSEVG